MKLARINDTLEIVRVVSKNRGWYTVKPADGPDKKVRKSNLKILGDAEIMALTKTVAPVAPPTKMVDPNLTKYTTHKMKTPSGRRAVDIADPAADMLRGVAIEDCYFLVAKHAAKLEVVEPEDLRTEEQRIDDIEAALLKKYAKLNLGMQRMNLGNVLRKAMGIYGNINAHKVAKYGPGM